MATKAQGDGTLTQDGNNIPIQVSSRFANRDNSGTPIESPVLVSSSTVTLTPPTNAIGVWITASDQPLLVGDNEDLDNSNPDDGEGCDIVLSGDKVFIGTTNMNAVYIKRATSDVLVYFRWEF